MVGGWQSIALLNKPFTEANRYIQFTIQPASVCCTVRTQQREKQLTGPFLLGKILP